MLLLLLSAFLTQSLSTNLNSTNNEAENKVVFVGDSITAYWAIEGEKVWHQYYQPYGAIDLGFPGDTTEMLYKRLLNGLVDGLKPKVAVMMIGTNNLNAGQNDTNQVIFDQINTLIHELRGRMPGVKVLLLGVLPRQNLTFCTRIEQINRLISRYEDHEFVRFLDMTDMFETSPGNLRQNLYKPDLVHLSGDGYLVWAQTMNNLFTEMINS